jgi:nucleoporin POM34
MGSYLTNLCRLQANEQTQLVLVWALRIFQVIVLCNGLLAIRPLLPFGPKDDFSDIALTPRQRELLGLPASSTPPTPGSTYITPPRYVRTTPRAVSATSSRMATAGTSPGTRSTTDSPLGLRSSTFGSGGSLSASPASGLVRRATVAGSKRWSLGSGAGLKALEDSIFGPTPPTPSTPTPNSGQRATVALNNKWLYKRQHGSPGGSTKYI